MSMTTKNIIQFRNGFINLPVAYPKTNNFDLATTFAAELMQFGYILTSGAVGHIALSEREDIISLYNEIIPFLKEMSGCGRDYKAFYSGFPQQVMSMSETDLWLDQIMHYGSNGEYLPNEWTAQRATAFEQPSYTTIKEGNDNMLLDIFTRLVGVNQSLTNEDQEIVSWFIQSGQTLRYPSTIPFKENLCHVLGALYASGRELGVENSPKLTVTDVLRLAVYLSDGDVSLPKVPPANPVRRNAFMGQVANAPRESFRFKKFTRKERRFILSVLELTNCDASEAVVREQRWIRLGEILHPMEYKNKFPRAAKLFDQLRNEKIASWYGKVDRAFAESFEAGVNKLAERGGEFMRRLDWMLREWTPKGVVEPPLVETQFDALKILFANVVESQVDVLEMPNGTISVADRAALVLAKLPTVISSVSNKVLYETYSHFQKRLQAVENRSIMVKGARVATQLPSLPAIDTDVVDAVTAAIMEGLKSKFASLPSLGDVWLDEELMKIPLPTNMRSMNASLKPMVRGTRIPMGNQNAKVIRAYVHWYDEDGTLDIDLSTMFVGAEKIDFLSWNRGKNKTIGTHSGDVRQRVGACAEYVDINIAQSLTEGFEYVVIDARDFNEMGFQNIPECVFGYMEREHPECNPLFVPKTLANSVRLTSGAVNTLVAIIDLKTQEYIFLDIDQLGSPIASSNSQKTIAAIHAYLEAPKFSVYDLLKLHVESRGKMVSKEEAETHLEFSAFSESYVETLQWMGV
jgi:hypothetical protein